MKNLNAQTGLKKTIGALALVGAMALPVLVTSLQAAQAAPQGPGAAWDQRGYDNGNYDNRRDNDNRDNDRRGDDRRGNDRRDRRDRDDHHGFAGTVTSVKSDDKFDISIDGKIYNVYTTSRLPRRLNRGDVVMVRGDRVGNNDIRNAQVSVIRNR